MDATSLTVRGFNQPAVTRALIELPGNAEKGLSQLFLWMFPKPVYANFATLEPTDKTFTDKIGKPQTSVSIMIQQHVISCSSTIFQCLVHVVTLLAGMWKKPADGKDVGKKVFHLPLEESQLALFKQKYDRTQTQLQAIAAMDDLLSGV